MIIIYQFVQINFIMCTRDRTTCIGVLDNNKSNFMVDMSVFVQTSKSYYRFGPLVASVVLLQFCLFFLTIVSFIKRERERGRGVKGENGEAKGWYYMVDDEESLLWLCSHQVFSELMSFQTGKDHAFSAIYENNLYDSWISNILLRSKASYFLCHVIVKWLKYCGYSPKHQAINQSINPMSCYRVWIYWR